MSKCNCGGCGSSSSNCNYDNVCGCSVMISTICVVYQGNMPLDAIGTQNGTRLESTLININEAIKNIQEQVLEGFILENVGNGNGKVFKEVDDDGISYLRSIAGSDSINITNYTDTISVSVNEDYIKSLVSTSIGDLTELIKRVTTLEGSVTSISKDVEDLKKRVSLVTVSDEFIGQSVLSLSNKVDSIVFVSYNGLVLAKGKYTLQTPTDTLVNGAVSLNLAAEELPIEGTDTILVVYNTKN